MNSHIPQLVDYQIIRGKIKINAKKDNITLPYLLNLWDISEIYPNFAYDGVTILYKMNDFSSWGNKKNYHSKHFQYTCSPNQAEKLTNDILKFQTSSGTLPSQSDYPTINNTQEESIIDDDVTEPTSNLTSPFTPMDFWNVGQYPSTSYKCSPIQLPSTDCLSDDETDLEMPDLQSISSYSSETEEEDPVISHQVSNKVCNSVHLMMTRSKSKSKSKVKVPPGHLDFDDIVKHYE
jgi:hypothetical protein